METCKTCSKEFRNVEMHYARSKCGFPKREVAPCPTVYDYLGEIPTRATITFRMAEHNPIDLCETLLEQEPELMNRAALDEGGPIGSGLSYIYVLDENNNIPMAPMFVIYDPEKAWSKKD